MRRLRTLVGAIVLFGSSVPAAAQFRVDQFTTSNGLPQNTVAAIAQTPDGYLWIATYDGLVRYDGVRFTIYDKGNTPAIRSNQFLAVHVDPEGTLWGGTVEGGLIRMRDGVFAGFTTENGLASNYIGRFVDTPSGLLVFYPGDSPSAIWTRQDTVAPAGDRAQSEFVDRSKASWTLAPNGLRRVRDGRERVLPVSLVPNEFARFRYEDRRGDLWIGTRGRGLYRVSGDTVSHFTARDGIPENTVVKVGGEDRDGNLWIFSDHALIRYAGGTFSRVEDRIFDQGIRAVFCDREGTVWIGTNAKGLYRLAHSILTVYGQEQGLTGRAAYPVFEDRDGTVWVGSGQGLTVIDPTGQTKQFSGSASAIAQDQDGRVWIGVNQTVRTYANGTFSDVPLPVAKATVQAILPRPGGVVLVGTTEGILQLGTGGLVRRFGIADGLPDLNVNLLFADSHGRVWAGTRGGLARLDRDRFVAVTTRDGLVGDRIRAMYEDRDGALWIGTFDSGLSRLKDGRFTNYTTRDGLFNNGVFAIVEDARSNFWISCNRGIYRVSRPELNAFADGRIGAVSSVAYGTQDGMLSAECNGGRQPSAAKTRDGKIWFPTQNGIAIVDPSTVVYNTETARVVIESVSIGDHHVDWRSGIDLAPGSRELEINYTAPSSIKAEHIRFKYRLEGLDADWTDAGARRSVRYSNLAPRHYTFFVLAANSDGVWNDQGVSLAIIVRPFFYETRGFLAIATALAAAVASGAYVLRVRRLKHRERRLTELVKTRTSELQQRSAQLEIVNQALSELATLDPLTGLANRRRFDVFVQQEWLRAQRARRPLSLLMADTDLFKAFNDTYGHQAGDECLKQIAAVLADTANRVSDLAARYGGEEFAVVMPDTDLAGAHLVAETIRSKVEALAIPHAHGPAGVMTVSIGVVAIVPELRATSSSIIEAADKAMYEAKARGRNLVCDGTV